jgi:heme/copper-type cytochrome/quinol oxidase subunit 2
MENSSENRKIEIGHESLSYLDTTRKWTMFFSILGFIGLGIMLLFSLLAGTFIKMITSMVSGASSMSGMEGMDGVAAPAAAIGGAIGIIIFIFALIFAVIYFFPLLYLFRFSKHTKNAVANMDANELQLGLKNLKSYWKYIGILVIVVLAIYFLAFLIVLL